ncbi:MAG: hypothetical protein IJX11_02290 [Bacteroidales bacterium]|nr:hypothetical protein [Bacteroidales bacterium]
MKRIIFILAALFSVAVLSSSIFVNRSKEEWSLKTLWAEYQEVSEQQLSGWSGGFFRPLSYGFISVSPYAYREVKDAVPFIGSMCSLRKVPR